MRAWGKLGICLTAAGAMAVDSLGEVDKMARLGQHENLRVAERMDNEENDNDGTVPSQEGHVQISASDKQLKGRYANLMSVSHTPEEFVLDFFAVTPAGEGPRGHLVSRVIVSPSHYKRIVAALADNLRKYEEQFGEVEDPGDSPRPEDIGFVH